MDRGYCGEQGGHGREWCSCEDKSPDRGSESWTPMVLALLLLACILGGSRRCSSRMEIEQAMHPLVLPAKDSRHIKKYVTFRKMYLFM